MAFVAAHRLFVGSFYYSKTVIRNLHHRMLMWFHYRNKRTDDVIFTHGGLCLTLQGLFLSEIMVISVHSERIRTYSLCQFFCCRIMLKLFYAKIILS